MELLEAIKIRKSIRAFTADRVPGEVLKEILIRPLGSPSSGNTSHGNLSLWLRKH